MKISIMPQCGTRAEYVALFEAIATATPENSEREQELFSAFAGCVDQLLENVTPEQVHRILATYRSPRKRRLNR